MRLLKDFSLKQTHKILAIVALAHITSVICLVLFWDARWFAMSLVAYFIFAVVLNESFGHRYLCHKMFRLPRILHWIGCIAYVTTLIGKPAHVIATHKLHHKHSDTNKDPTHDAKGWKVWFWVNPSLTEEFSIAELRRATRDTAVALVSRYYFFLYAVIFLAVFVISPIAAVYCLCVPLVLSFHHNSMINVVCHRYGYNNQEPMGNAKNNLIVNALGLFGGAALHSNHHAAPMKPYFAERWYEIDIAGCLIKLFRLKST